MHPVMLILKEARGHSIVIKKKPKKRNMKKTKRILPIIIQVAQTLYILFASCGLGPSSLVVRLGLSKIIEA